MRFGIIVRRAENREALLGFIGGRPAFELFEPPLGLFGGRPLHIPTRHASTLHRFDLPKPRITDSWPSEDQPPPGRQDNSLRLPDRSARRLGDCRSARRAALQLRLLQRRDLAVLREAVGDTADPGNRRSRRRADADDAVTRRPRPRSAARLRSGRVAHRLPNPLTALVEWDDPALRLPRHASSPLDRAFLWRGRLDPLLRRLRARPFLSAHLRPGHPGQRTLSPGT